VDDWRERFQEDVRRGLWNDLRDLLLERGVFRPMPSLARLNPRTGQAVEVAPYHGQPYDPRQGRVLEGGWDHEHCFVCQKQIREGDTCWIHDEPQVVLCDACHMLMRTA
jgi:hypothetical protein